MMSRLPGELVLTKHPMSLWQNHDLFYDEDLSNGIYGQWIQDLDQGVLVIIISMLLSIEVDLLFGRWYYIITTKGECGWVFAPFNHDPFDAAL